MNRKRIGALILAASISSQVLNQSQVVSAFENETGNLTVHNETKEVKEDIEAEEKKELNSNITLEESKEENSEIKNSEEEDIKVNESIEQPSLEEKKELNSNTNLEGIVQEDVEKLAETSVENTKVADVVDETKKVETKNTKSNGMQKEDWNIREETTAYIVLGVQAPSGGFTAFPA